MGFYVFYVVLLSHLNSFYLLVFVVRNAHCFLQFIVMWSFLFTFGSDPSHPKGEGTVERDQGRFPDLLNHIMAQGAAVGVHLGVQAGAEARVLGELVEAWVPGHEALIMKTTQGNQMETGLLVHELEERMFKCLMF